MSGLALYLLGPPRIEYDGQPVRVNRRKAIALVAYLAVTGESQRRDALVNLLWPDYDGSRGRGALRRTLFALRKALPGDWLDVSREAIGIQPGVDLWLDVDRFRHHLATCESHGHPPSQVCPACVAPLTDAVEMVRGDFLSGFSLKDSINFDDWQLFQAELVRRELTTALERLVRWHSAGREFEPAVGYARRRLGLDPLDEGAYRQLMRLYAWSGRRPAALRQYKECEAVLEDQLGVPPHDRTAALYHLIQGGDTPPLPEEKWEQETPLPSHWPLEPGASPPSFLEGEVPVEMPVFVARERELAQFDGYLDAALDGRGRVVFVTGEAGSGKTALIQAFARRAQAAHPDLIVAWGQGNAQTGVGDPYLPFREVLGLLSGDVEAQWDAGAMTREQASRLWYLLPLAVEALVRTGPDLIDLLLPGAPLLERARAIGPWPTEPDLLAQLETLVARRAAAPGIPTLQRSALFEQYTQVLRTLAGQKPLLLAVDDLQWADGGSFHLLFHLGRRIAGSRILLVGAYRPAEIILGRSGSLPLRGAAEGTLAQSRDRHPLEPIVNEFKRTFGDIQVDLERTEGRPFVDALLDSEPNRLGDAFREALHRRTRGQPLFTVELLRGMQERGDLVRDGEGAWVEAPALDWETLPARVEAVVAERIDRLPHGFRELLRVASVEGETFTAEVVAQVQTTAERETVRSLSQVLDRQHRLVRARGILRVAGQRLSQYRFRHILFQKYLYSTLDQVERAYLHEQVGTVLEGLYKGPEVAPVAVQLARHFEEAGMTEEAIDYLHQAADRALQLSAYEEAIPHLTRGLALLMTLPDTPERDQEELSLQLVLGMARIGHGTFDREVETAYARARHLGRQTGETGQLCQALGEMAIFHYVRAEHDRALGLATEALSQAQRAGDPLLVVWSHWCVGLLLFCRGEYVTAQEHLGQVTDYYDPDQHHTAFTQLPGADAGLSAMAYSALGLWSLGYPDQALRQSHEALALARKTGHTMTLADVLCYGGCVLHAMRRDAPAIEGFAAELLRLAQKAQTWLGPALWHRGAAMAMMGQVDEGIAQIRKGIAAHLAADKRIYLPAVLSSLAEAQAQAGQPGEGLGTLTEALALVEETDERHWEAELYRLRAELLLMQGDEAEAEAEASLHEAIEVARCQSARSWELRATTSLARLWQAQDRTAEARQMLAEIYGWFTEGFDTPDLQEARALLDELS